MSNQLKMPKIQSILTLREKGWSFTRIAKELGIHRQTVARYVRLHSKPSQAPTGSGGAKSTQAPTGSVDSRSTQEDIRGQSAGGSLGRQMTQIEFAAAAARQSATM